MLEDVKARLKDFNYTPGKEDDLALGFVITKMINQVKADLNTLTVPDDLYNTVIDMIIGDYLLSKKNSGLKIGIDIDSLVVKAISEGDTKVDYATAKTAEERIEALLNYLISGSGVDFACYRKVRW